MSQQRIIRSANRCPGGHMVAIEITSAYTDGSSRFEQVFVARETVAGKSDDERMEAVRAALEDDPIAAVQGYDIEAWKTMLAVTPEPIAAMKAVFGGSK